MIYWGGEFDFSALKIELAEQKINTKQQIKTNEGVVLEFIL